MTLVVRAQTLNDQPLSQAIVGCFDRKGGTIGRSDTNTMSLPDAERRISRLQAEIHGSDTGFSIRNVGSSSPIFVNETAMAPGEGRALADGDSLRIGGYALQVRIEAENSAARMITDGRAVVDARAVIVGSVVDVRTDPPLIPTRAGASVPAAGNPFADLFASPPSAASAGDPFSFLSTPLAEGARAPAPAPLAPPSRLPDDFDPFAVLDAVAPASTTPSPSPVGAADLLGLVGVRSAPVSSLDDAFGLSAAGRPGEGDPLAAFLAATAPSSDLGGMLSTGPSVDPLAMFADAPAAPTAGPAAFDHTPELQGAYRPPSIVEAKGASPAPLRHPPVDAKPPPDDPFAGLGLSSIGSGTDPIADFLHAAPDVESPPAFRPQDASPHRAIEAPEVSTSTSADRATAPQSAPMRMPTPMTPPSVSPSGAPDAPAALWAAFCEGTRVPLALPHGLNADQMRMLGMLVREAVDGAVRLMALRAMTKTELRANVTVIRARNNNPLKFSPDCEAALTQMLQAPLRGFMPGPLAMQDAMHDLEGHAIGTMAGMKAALAGVLARFEPAQLEAKLAGKTMLDTVIPGARKARLWDLYLQHAEAIRLEAQEDFQKLFGEAFVAAYEEQLDQLQPRHD